MAKPLHWEVRLPPDPRSRVGIPTTVPSRSTNAPQLLPGLMAALIWMIEERLTRCPRPQAVRCNSRSLQRPSVEAREGHLPPKPCCRAAALPNRQEVPMKRRACRWPGSLPGHQVGSFRPAWRSTEVRSWSDLKTGRRSDHIVIGDDVASGIDFSARTEEGISSPPPLPRVGPRQPPSRRPAARELRSGALATDPGVVTGGFRHGDACRGPL